MLTNAIKYTPEDGQIQLTVEEKPSVYNGYGQFEITVTDNGIGMKPEFLEKYSNLSSGRMTRPFAISKGLVSAWLSAAISPR